MAKYWVFQSNQVNGPHDADDLSQLPGFSAETLVCPEGRKGTNMGDWQRASMVPELSVALLKASNLAVAMKGAAAGGSMFGSLPPEPTLKDLAALGSLQEKVSLLDATVGQLQESLRLKEQELLSVHRDLDDKTRHAQELAVKLGGVEERLSSVGELRQGLDAAVAAEHDVEETVKRQADTIEALTRELETLKADKAEIEALRIEMDQLKSRPAPKADLFGSRPAPEPSLPSAPQGATPSPFGASSLDAPSPFAPPTQPPTSPYGAPAPAGLGELSAPPAPAAEGVGAGPLGAPPESAGFPPAPSPTDASPFGAAPLGAPSLPPTQTFIPNDPLAPAFTAAPASGLEAPTPAFATAPPPVVEQPSSLTGDLAAPEKKSGKGKAVALVVVLLASGGGFAALKLGLVPGMPAPLPEPAPMPVVETPRTPTPEEQAEALKQQAIELVRQWPAAGGGSLAMKLETPSVAAGGSSPWQADRVRDSLFQVNFYSPKASGGSGQTYEFEADVAANRVTARNAAAVAALTGERKPESIASKRKPKIKPKASDDAPMLQDLLSLDGSTAEKGNPAEDASDEQAAAPAAKRAPRKAAKAKPEESLDELLAGAREPRRKKGKDEESLDQILLPGIPRRDPSLDEPLAEAAAKARAERPAEDEPETARAPAPRSKRAPKAAADAELLDDLLKP